WTKKWPSQTEIHAYFQKAAQDHNLNAHARFNTEVISGTWDSATNSWFVTLRDCSTGLEEIIMATCVISGVGQLNNPAYPNIQGLDGFKGVVMHSARWDHSVDLEGKVVGVIGTGASSIQFTPEVAKVAKHVHVFQRSPAYIMPRWNYTYSGLARWIFRNVPGARQLYRWIWIAVLDALFIGLQNKKFPMVANIIQYLLLANMRRQVKDANLRKKLTPDYPVGCKRTLISDEWYPTMQRSNVSVVTEPISRISENAVIVKDNESGNEIEKKIDVLLLGTGFKSTGFLDPMEFIGVDGISLRKEWRDGAEAYRGFAVSGFPNLFILYGPNTNLGHHSIIYMIECTMELVTQSLTAIFPTNPKSIPTPYVEVKKSSQDVYNRWIQSELGKTAYTDTCGSWYKVGKMGKVTNQWASFVTKYWLETRKLKVEDFVQAGESPFNGLLVERQRKAWMSAGLLVGLVASAAAVGAVVSKRHA
ncbi:hypothetical protein HDU76_012466, partial [Blyttiomyces sp. JEL0837]